jgi:hypothetical protein
MNTPSFPSLNEAQTRLSSPSDHRGSNRASKASRPWSAGLVDLRMEATDDDSNLIVLGKQLEEAVTTIRRLYDPASPDSHLELIESMLGQRFDGLNHIRLLRRVYMTKCG